MRILFIGGTRFLGAAMVREALARGHQADVFHRSAALPPGMEGARQLQGDRVRDLSALARGEWDAVIDTCGYRPGDIHAAADALAGRCGNYVFISSISVYAEDIPHDADESAARLAATALAGQPLDRVAVTAQTYGPLKVLCEDAVQARHAQRLLIRPTYIVGPGDYTQRFPEWVRRLAAGGEVDAPGPPEAAVQYIDARDLAAFVLTAVERRLHGAFNTCAVEPPFTFADLLGGIAAGVAPVGTSLRWLSVAQARASGRTFPLWNGGESSGLGAVSSRAARQQGLHCRPLAQTAADVLRWTRSAAS